MNHLSRRKFLQNAGIGTSLLSLSNSTLSAHNFIATLEPKKLNVALCGLGRYADAVAYGLHSSQYCQLNGLISGTPTKAAEWAKTYGVAQQNIYNYRNFDEIITNKDIDLVYVL